MNTHKNANYSGAKARVHASLRGMLFSWLALAFVTAAPLMTAAPAQALDAFQHACNLYNQRHYTAAKEAFIELVCAKPGYWPARYQLGNTYMQLGQMLEASMEYEKCLEETRDAKTKKNCLSALSYIKERTGAPMSDATEKQISAQVSQADDRLIEQGKNRLIAKEGQLEQERQEMISKAKVKANFIKRQAKEQQTATVSNSNWYVLDHNYNMVPAIPGGTPWAGVEAAEAKAEAVREAAVAKAESMKAPEQDEVTEALRSQLKNNAVKAKFRMSPVGTNVYVRNYKSTSTKNVATSPASSVK